MHTTRWALALAVLLCRAPGAAAQTTAQLSLRGHQQTLHLYGPPQGDPVIVSSGDGGWMHLAPHVAEVLSARGYFVIGFDTRGYLESFTTRRGVLNPSDEPGDYQVLVDYAARGRAHRPILIGVSEGAGLSVLAASDPATRVRIAGVLGLGLPDINELGWRWRDSLIYITHGIPKEPTFSTASVAALVAPAPLAAIQSTRDDFVSVAEVRRVIAAAHDPKRLWVITAGDHSFSDNLPELDRRLLEALAWIREHATP